MYILVANGRLPFALKEGKQHASYTWSGGKGKKKARQLAFAVFAAIAGTAAPGDVWDKEGASTAHAYSQLNFWSDLSHSFESDMYLMFDHIGK